MIHRSRTLLLTFLGLLFWVAPAEGASRVIRMAVGQQKVLAIPFVKRIAIGNTKVADVRAIRGGRQVLVSANGAGRTTLIVWRRDGRRDSFLIVVSVRDPRSLVTQVRTLLGAMEGVTIRIVGDMVVLDGKVLSASDYVRIQRVIALFPQVKSLVTVNKQARMYAASQLNLRFQRSGLTDVRAVVVGSKIFLEGSVGSRRDMRKALLITQAYGEKVENLLSIGLKRMILLEVQFVEITKKGQDRLGFKWPSQIQAGLMVTPGNGDFHLMVGPPTGFTPLTDANTGAMKPYFAVTGAALELHAMVDDGYARILAQPKLVCASGEKASFLAGGEIPIPMITAQTSQVEWKEYGVRLKAAPIARRNGTITTGLTAEVSDVDWSRQVQNIPAMLTRRVKTKVTVRDGETIILSGLFRNTEQKGVSKFPLLGHIPVIGELFKMRTFSEDKQELAIIVTPRIVSPDSVRVRQLIRGIQSRYRRAEQEVGFDIFD